MDSILKEQNVVILSHEQFEALQIEAENDFFEDLEDSFSEDDELYVAEKASLWVIDGTFCRPSTSLTIQKQLFPGVYTVEVSRENGLYCRKIKVESDELFRFSDSITTQLLEEISQFWDKADLYKEHKLLHKRGILLEGFPGNGKTSIISLLSEQIIKKGGVVFVIPNISNLNIYIEFIKNNFRDIEPNRPVISIIEDIDKYQGSDVLLDFLDGKTNIEHHIVLTTTNNTEDLPDAFLRPSRLDLRIEVPYPDALMRQEYFTFKKVPKDEIEYLVSISNELSLADLKELFVSIYLLGYAPDAAIEKVKKPRTSINYNRVKKKGAMGLY